MDRMSRRTVIGGLFATPLVAVALGRVLAQDDSTPQASPGGSPAASPGASPAASPMATPAAAGGEEISVTAVDIAFEEEELTIPADTDVTVTVTNNGFLQHDWVVEDTDIASPMLNGGDSAEVVVNLPAGTYTYYCSVAGHREAGMQGSLTVG